MKTVARADAAGLLVLGRIGTSIVAALSPLFLVRLLPKQDVGVLSGLLLIHATAAMVTSSGSDRAVLFFLADRDPADRRAVTSRIAWMLTGLGALVGLLMAGFAGASALFEWTFSGLTPSRLALLGLYVSLDVPTRLLPNLLVAEQRPAASAAMQVVRSAGLVSATLLPPALGGGVDLILWSLCSFSILYLLGFWAWVSHLYRGTSRDGQPEPWRSLVGFTAPLALNDLVGWFNATLDRYLVLAFFPVEKFAEYRAGAWQIPILTSIPYSIGAVDTTRFASLMRQNRGADVIAMWRASIHKTSLIVIPVALAFALAAEPFVRLAFTAAYEDAAPVFRWYCLITLLRVAAFGPVLVAAGQPKSILKATALTLSSNLLLSIPCLFWFGFEGPAIGTFLTVFPTYLVWSLFISRATGVPFRGIFPWRLVGLVTACAGLPGALALALAHWYSLGDLSALLVILFGTVTGFGLLGSASRLIVPDDWRFLRRWLSGKVLRSSGE
ncbi:MAG TPA: hypothetical protein DCQ06_12710 [Myxococcales bacterium]|nr:hypothetical protein [Myxococcales bacterium]